MQASGKGSVLDFPALQNIYGPNSQGTTLTLKALNGGQFNLGNVTNILGSIAGLSGAGTQVTADGAGSLIILTNLLSFTDQSSGGTSFLWQMNGGLILLNPNAVLEIAQYLSPFILTQPQSVVAPLYTPATFSVSIFGSLPLFYRWFFNGTLIADATSASFGISSVTTSNAGNYSVVITNVYGSVTSSPAVLTVIWAPTITIQPVSQTTSAGGAVTFTIQVAAYPEPTYQWRLDGANISGATGSSYTIPSASFTNAGYYDVVVVNTAGTNISSSASLAIVDIKMYAGINIYGPLGADYSLQEINALGGTNWNVLTNVALPSQPYIYIDYSSPTNRQQFYRAVPQ
jgi:hypothetical protein